MNKPHDEVVAVGDDPGGCLGSPVEHCLRADYVTQGVDGPCVHRRIERAVDRVCERVRANGSPVAEAESRTESEAVRPAAVGDAREGGGDLGDEAEPGRRRPVGVAHQLCAGGVENEAVCECRIDRVVVRFEDDVEGPAAGRSGRAPSVRPDRDEREGYATDQQQGKPEITRFHRPSSSSSEPSYLMAAGKDRNGRRQSRVSSATVSTCGVCGNMSTGRAETSRYPHCDASTLRSPASVVGLHET